MAQSTHQKLRIKAGMNLLTLHAPPNFEEQLQPLPADVSVSDNVKDYHQMHWFVRNKIQLEREMDKVIKLVKENVLCWIYYPKGTSKIQTDLTRDKGWEALLIHSELQWLSLISFDETWSCFGFRIKTEKDKKKETQPKEREIFKFIDAAKKEIILPVELAEAFSKHACEQAFFQSLSFTNQKEFVEWIVTAKREETRRDRVLGTIERLSNQWKNPRNI